MADRAIVRIEYNDDDKRFREKCNSNFQQLASGVQPSGSTLRIIQDSIGFDVDAVLEAVFDMCHPIGDIIFTNDFNDTRLQRGRWKQHKDVQLVAAGDIFSLNETGGEISHTLTEDELPRFTSTIPPHTHTQKPHTHIQDEHNHIQDAHTHIQNAHAHTQAAHNHTSTAHTHTGPSHTHTGPAHTHSMDAVMFWVGTGGNVTPNMSGSSMLGTTRQTGSSGTGNTGASGTGNTGSTTPGPTGSATPTINATTATNQPTTATNQPATPVIQPATAINEASAISTEPVGGGQPHNNMGPYLGKYCFERIA